MDEQCESPRMFEALRRGPEAAADGEGWEDMQWARNRTVVLFGDSVARENVVYFCEVRSSLSVDALELTSGVDDRCKTRKDHLGSPLRPFPPSDTNTSATRASSR